MSFPNSPEADGDPAKCSRYGFIPVECNSLSDVEKFYGPKVRDRVSSQLEHQKGSSVPDALRAVFRAVQARGLERMQKVLDAEIGHEPDASVWEFPASTQE